MMLGNPTAHRDTATPTAAYVKVRLAFEVFSVSSPAVMYRNAAHITMMTVMMITA